MKLERPFPTRAQRARHRELPTHTDWTRILYCDVAGTCDAGSFARHATPEEPEMNAIEDSRRAAGTCGHDHRAASGGLYPTRPHTDESVQVGAHTPVRRRPLPSPLRQGALLLAIYVGMYSTVAVLVHVAHVLADDVSASFVTPAAGGSLRPAGRDTTDRVACAASTPGEPCARA